MAKFQMTIVIREKECLGFAKFDPPIPKNMEWKFDECTCPFAQGGIERAGGWDCGCTHKHECSFMALDSDCGNHRAQHCPFGSEERSFPMGEIEIPDSALEIYK